MDTLVLKRKTVFSDAAEIEKLRVLGNSIKTNALGKLPELLAQLEEKCTANGIQVHWAETIPEANQLVLDIMKSHGATRLVKGKSMVSEEAGATYLVKGGRISGKLPEEELAKSLAVILELMDFGREAEAGGLN